MAGKNSTMPREPTKKTGSQVGAQVERYNVGSACKTNVKSAKRATRQSDGRKQDNLVNDDVCSCRRPCSTTAAGGGPSNGMMIIEFHWSVKSGGAVAVGGSALLGDSRYKKSKKSLPVTGRLTETTFPSLK